ncbi:MAG: DNA topoisomerase III [Epulopiscium sp. Nele67-Bin004]|nr:MAG: DNA topoisomerase III [Epulopiscium sp. Nele67-Bin004]
MGKIVVLAEKPSVARDIAKVLNCHKKGSGFLEGDKYIITWGLGHLVTLATPEKYGDQYKEWSMETLPMLPKFMKTEVIGKTSKHFSDVKKVLNRNDVDSLVIATDPAREGELVARWIIEKSGFKKPLSRLWISSQTDKAIRDGFKNLKSASNYESLYKSAVCRAEADWILGLNVTRALTCKYNAQLSAGRVQSATLAMIVNREQDIKSFKPKNFYTINAKSKNITLKWQDSKGQTRLWDEDTAKQLVKKLSVSEAKVVSVKETLKKQYSPIFYDLTELQRDANRIFGYSAKQTLSIMQKLYEHHKILTYPRTDSKHITTDIVPTLKDRFLAVAVGEYRSIAMTLSKQTIKVDKRFADNNKVSDHHGIIPTEEKVNLLALSTDEKKIYDLVLKRFLAVFMQPYEYLQTTVNCDINGETFVTRGRIIKSEGYKTLYKDNFDEDDEEDDKRELPPIKEGSTLKIDRVEYKTDKTKPPVRFTEGSLLGAMEKPHQHVTISSNLAKTLGETGGIGTVATRADIIEKLFNSFYVEKNGNEIVPTSKGRQLMELVPEDLKSPIMTAKWEQDFDLISKGKKNPKEFIDDMKKYTTKLVNDVKNSSARYNHDNKTGRKCPTCAQNLLEVKTKMGINHVCQDRNCGYKINVSKFTNTKCPKCYKKLELRGPKESQSYVCVSCGFKEKSDSFNKKYRSGSTKADKKAVQNYMKQQNKQDEGNFAFASAFANLKIDND